MKVKHQLLGIIRTTGAALSDCKSRDYFSLNVLLTTGGVLYVHVVSKQKKAER